MPTIGRADIEVHYDGKGLPREARELGKEAGGEAGEAYAEEFNKSSRDGLTEGAEKRREELRKGAVGDGESDGKAYGTSYSDARDRILIDRANRAAKAVADVFNSEDGFDDFRQNIKKNTGVLLDVDSTAREVTKHIDEMFANGQFEPGEYEKLKESLDGIKTRAKDIDDIKFEKLRAEAQRLSEEVDKSNQVFIEKAEEIDQIKFDNLRAEADKVNEAFDHNARSIEAARKKTLEFDEDTRFLKETLRDQNKEIKHENDLLRDGEQRHRDLSRAMDAVDAAALRLNPNLQRHSELIERIGDVARTGSTAEGYHSLAKEIHATADDSEKAAKKLEALSGGVDKAGDSAGKHHGSFLNLGSALGKLGQFDPADNMGQLFALIIALAPQVAILAEAAGGGLTILAGGAAALALAVGGGFLGFSNLFGDLKNVQPTVQPAAKALQDFAGKDGLSLLRDALQAKMFVGLAGEFDSLRLNTIPALEPAFASLGGAINKVLTRWVTDLQSSGFAQDFDDLIKSLNPSVVGLGTLFSNLTGIVQQVLVGVAPYTKDFIDQVSDASGKFLTFLKTPEGKTAIKDFFDRTTDILKHVGDLFLSVGKALADLITPQNIENTKQILDNIGKALPDLIAFGGDLQTVVVTVAKAIEIIAAAIKTIGDAFNIVLGIGDTFLVRFQGLLSGSVNAVISFAKAIGDAFGGVASGIKKIASGDVEGGLRDIHTGLDKSKQDFKDFGENIATAMGNVSATFDSLPVKAQNGLTDLAGRLSVSGENTKDFGGTIAQVSAASGVSIGTISKAKGWEDLQKITGVSEGYVDSLRAKFEDSQVKSSAALSKLSTDAQTHLGAVSKKLGVSGEDSKGFATIMAGAGGASEVALKKLADAKSWGDIEAALKSAGAKSKTEMADRIIAAANNSGESLDKLPPKIGELVAKYGTIPASKSTKIIIDGAEDAIATSGRVGAALAALHDKRINITQVVSQIGDPGKLGGKGATAIGGIMAGGQLIAGGMAAAFANGGVLNSPQIFGNVLAGEAGSEAIVPLTGPLSAVDASVRSLAAYARGKVLGGQGSSSGGGKSVTVSPGAVQVHTYNANANQIASGVIDRLVPQL